MTLTDLPSELPLLRENVETNRGSPPHCPVTVKPLKWGDAAAMGSVGTNFAVVLVLGRVVPERRGHAAGAV